MDQNVDSNKKYVNRYHCTLREEPSQINVILQQKMSAAKLSAVCTVYKQ